MSHAATNWAIRQKGLKPATKIVLWHLCDRHNPDTGCFPKQETLAADCEMSRSTLNLHLSKLEELGLIKRDAGREQGSMKHRPTRYWLAFESAETVSESRTISVSENRTYEPKTVSEKHAKPCPNFDENRVLNSDTNSVREPVREPVSKGRDVAQALEAWALPASVASFLAYRRKSKGGAMTLTGAKRLATHLKAIFDAGGDTDDALAMAEERGWRTVEPDWYWRERNKSNGNGSRGANRIPQGGKRPDPALEQIARLAGIG